MYTVGNAIRVPDNPGNPPVFKLVNAGLRAGKKPGLTLSRKACRNGKQIICKKYLKQLKS